MTKLLLDHPWPLDATMDGQSPAFKKLQHFHSLIRRLKVAAVPFITAQERDDAISRLNCKHNGAAAAAIKRFADELVYPGHNAQPAVVTPAPNDLSPTWLCSLRQEIETCTGWRVPQIIFPDTRTVEWLPHPAEVQVQCGTTLADCVLAPLETHDSHRYALSDVDPWKQNHWLRQSPPGHARPHPCWLPIHPALENVPLERIADHLGIARKQGWHVGDRYYFIPPMNYQPADFDKPHWRNGRAFEVRNTRDGRGGGYVDCEDRIWVWARAPAGHQGERHWDVQLNPGWRNISHDGREL
jgi:hypothetical protein